MVSGSTRRNSATAAATDESEMPLNVDWALRISGLFRRGRGRRGTLAPRCEGAERVVDPGVAAQEALHLTACRLWNRAGRHQRDAVQLDAVHFGDGLAQLTYQLLAQILRDFAWVDFRDEGDAVTADVTADSHRSHAADANTGVPALRRPFQVLGEVFDAANDQQVLDATGHMQLAV